MAGLALITGATGLVGGTVARRWLARGLNYPGDIRVRAFVRDPRSPGALALKSLGAELHPGDLLDPSTFPAACADCQLVLHAGSDMRLESRANVWAIGVEGTRRLFEAARAGGTQRFLFTSSLAVYGGMDGELNEEIPAQPWGELYGDAKIAAEQALQSASQAGGTRLFILRLGAVYGPGCRGWTEDPLQRAQRGRLAVPGDGAFPLPYLYRENMADAVDLAARSPRPGTYDIFDGITTYRGFVQNYARMAGAHLRSVPYPALMALASLSELLAWATGRYARLNRRVAHRLRSLSRRPLVPRRPEKAMRDLGWSPRVPLDEGMRRIAERAAQST